MSTAEYRESASPISGLGTGADTGPGAFILPPVNLRRYRMSASHVYTNYAVYDPVQNRVSVDLDAESLATVLLLKMGEGSVEAVSNGNIRPGGQRC